jgi:hypothetical protein
MAAAQHNAGTMSPTFVYDYDGELLFGAVTVIATLISDGNPSRGTLGEFD